MSERNGLRAMLWKEWRENARWGALALLGIGLSLVYVVAQADSPNSNGAADICAAVWGTTNQVLTLGCPVVGLLLGFAQILPELRRDGWAFLVHRPASPSVLFRGKAVTGLGLALAAAGLPFLAFVLWAATPGDVATPFDPRLTLAGLASLLTTVPFYFAGMLSALRPARWYGSRLLPLAAALLAAILVTASDTFGQAILTASVFGLALGAAVWGSFRTRGEWEGQPAPAKAALGATLLSGTVVAVLALTMLGAILVAALLPQNYHSSNTDYQIDTQGHILRVTRVVGGGSDVTTWADLNGHPIGSTQSGYPNDIFLSPDSLLMAPRPAPTWPFPRAGEYRSTGETVASLHQDSNPRVFWYYVPAQGRALGYDRTTRRLVQTLGPSGFSRGAPPSGPRFQGQYFGGGSDLLLGTRTVSWVDLSRPSLTRLYTASPSVWIQGVCEAGASDRVPNGLPSEATRVVVAAGNHFHVLTPQGRPLFTVSREYDPARYGDVTVLVTPDRRRFFFQYRPSPDALTADPRLPSYVTEVSERGAVLRRDTLPALPVPPRTPPDPWTAASGLLAPPSVPVALLAALEIGHVGGDPSADSTRQALADLTMRPFWLRLLAVSVLSGLLSAVLAWRIARRCVLSPRAGLLWALGVLWLGPYGVLMLLALREWPARVPCPHCGRKRVVTREACEHCGAAFPRPARDGTEIFDTGRSDVEAREAVSL